MTPALSTESPPGGTPPSTSAPPAPAPRQPADPPAPPVDAPAKAPEVAGKTPGSATTSAGNGARAAEGNGKSAEGNGKSPNGAGKPPGPIGKGPEGGGKAPEGAGLATEGTGTTTDGNARTPDSGATTPASAPKSATEGESPATARPASGEAPPASAGATDTSAPAPEQYKTLAVVLLPLESPAFARAAEAVKRGFLTAARSKGDQERVFVVAYGDGGLDDALVAARFADPEWIVGPLTREDVAALAKQAEPLPHVLALNQPDDPDALPAQVVTFTLAVEGEARQAAARMQRDGIGTVALVIGGGALQRRSAAAFESEWRKRGGTITARLTVNDASVGRRIREEVRRGAPDAIFLALDAGEAQRVRPALGSVRVFATSQVYNGQDSTLLRDLEGVRFFAMPWVVQPDNPAVAPYARDDSGNSALDALYAFGIDAYQLFSALRSGNDPAKVSVDGVTGHIALASPRQFGRDGVLTEIREGRLVPLAE